MPVFPLGNGGRGGAVVYGALALGWLALSWRDPPRDSPSAPALCWRRSAASRCSRWRFSRPAARFAMQAHAAVGVRAVCRRRSSDLTRSRSRARADELGIAASEQPAEVGAAPMTVLADNRG